MKTIFVSGTFRDGVVRMKIMKTQNASAVTLALEGRLDSTTAPELETELKDFLDDASEIVFDMEKLDYISSAGLRVLLSAQKVMVKKGGMKVIHANETVMEIFEITGFSDILNIEKTDRQKTVVGYGRSSMSDYLLETKLRAENRVLHRLTKDSAAVLQKMLESFLPRFPDFTDHTILHSMDVLEYCNLLLGEKQIEMLTAAECYVLIMSCYLHDIGMGINQKNYEELSKEINFGDYFETHSRENTEMIIRDFHNEYSGLFIRKYADLFDIPCEEMVFAIVQMSRGHRKTDLLDENEYHDLMTKDGVIRTAFLSAIVRLADEIDVGADRNSELLFDSSKVHDIKCIEAFGTHESIRRVEVREDAIVLYIKPKAPEYRELICNLVKKTQETLDYCRTVAALRSDFRITQTSVKTVEIQD